MEVIYGAYFGNVLQGTYRGAIYTPTMYATVAGSLAVGPRFGSMLGGAAFIVSGPCFDVASAATDLVCRFADLVSPAVVLDATRAKCVLPMTLRTGRVPVALSLDGGANYNHTSMFTLGKVNAATNIRNSQITATGKYAHTRIVTRVLCFFSR